MSSSALIIGEALIDAVVATDGTTSKHPGGSPANVALGLGRLGREVDLLTWLADDADGDLIRAHLAASGVEVLAGDRRPDHTPVATAHLDATGAATYVFDLEWDVPDTYPQRDEPPVVAHTGSISSMLAPGAEAVERELRRLRPTSTISFDPNARPSIVGPASDNLPIVERLVALADVVKVSDEDLAWLYPGEAPQDVAVRWAGSGPALVVVTMGGEGAFAATEGGQTLTVPAPKVQVADTVGAGDSFMGGLIDGLWSAGLLGAAARPALHAVTADQLRPVLERCARIAAITVSRPGANPPGSDEL